MKFDIKHIDDTIVFKLNEKKLDANISGLVKAEFTLLLKVEGESKLVIDLSEVEACDSSGLSALLIANRLINNNGGGLRIIVPSEKIRQLISITQLDRVLTLSESVDIAIKELQEELL
jgi:anti-anti-sigma factor